MKWPSSYRNGRPQGPPKNTGFVRLGHEPALTNTLQRIGHEASIEAGKNRKRLEDYLSCPRCTHVSNRLSVRDAEGYCLARGACDRRAKGY